MNITEPGTVVTEFKSNAERITELIIDKQNVQYFPRGLATLFPGLQHLAITNCSLREISREDLTGLTSLKTLNLDSNYLNGLPDDVFNEIPQLEEFSCQNNKLNISFLMPLRNHRNVDLTGNEIRNVKM